MLHFHRSWSRGSGLELVSQARNQFWGFGSACRSLCVCFSVSAALQPLLCKFLLKCFSRCCRDFGRSLHSTAIHCNPLQCNAIRAAIRGMNEVHQRGRQHFCTCQAGRESSHMHIPLPLYWDNETVAPGWLAIREIGIAIMGRCFHRTPPSNTTISISSRMLPEQLSQYRYIGIESGSDRWDQPNMIICADLVSRNVKAPNYSKHSIFIWHTNCTVRLSHVLNGY